MEDRVYSKDIKTKGKSLFAKNEIKKGEIALIIKGEIVNKPTIYTIPIEKDKFIDDSNLGRYLCHSCNPNCGIKDKTKIVAMRDIKKDEEITIDYAMIVSRYENEMTNENRICKCGEDNCRGELGEYSKLSSNLKKKYKGFISEYLLKLNK
jgi:uncharacterized protein